MAGPTQEVHDAVGRVDRIDETFECGRMDAALGDEGADARIISADVGVLCKSAQRASQNKQWHQAGPAQSSVSHFRFSLNGEAERRGQNSHGPLRAFL